MREQSVKNVEKEFLEPSFRYLVKNGLENTSIRDLCRVMEISYGSLYYWFDGKDDVYISVARYGISKVADALFGAVFEKIHTPEKLFNTFLDDVDRYKLELRLVFQMATSPVYGERIREKALDFNAGYEKYTRRLAEIAGITVEKLEPIIYMLISILVDYVVWEDHAVSKMQLAFLYKSFCGMIAAE